MSVWTWLKRQLGSSDHLDGRSGKKYIETLRTKFLKISKAPEPEPESPAAGNGRGKKKGEKSGSSAHAGDVKTAASERLHTILSRYDEATRKDKASRWKDTEVWADAYECDQLLVVLYPDGDVRPELELRIEDAKRRKLDFAVYFEAKLQALVDTREQGQTINVPRLRTLLGQLIEQQQWHDNQLYLKRRFASAAQKRVSITFIVALLLFGAMLIDHFNCGRILGDSCYAEIVAADQKDNGNTELQIDGGDGGEPPNGNAGNIEGGGNADPQLKTGED